MTARPHITLACDPLEVVFPSIVANKLNGINRITVIGHDSFTGGGQFANPMDVSMLSVNGQVATTRGGSGVMRFTEERAKWMSKITSGMKLYILIVCVCVSVQ